jgi:hypothetical protein
LIDPLFAYTTVNKERSSLNEEEEEVQAGDTHQRNARFFSFQADGSSLHPWSRIPGTLRVKEAIKANSRVLEYEH